MDTKQGGFLLSAAESPLIPRLRKFRLRLAANWTFINSFPLRHVASATRPQKNAEGWAGGSLAKQTKQALVVPDADQSPLSQGANVPFPNQRVFDGQSPAVESGHLLDAALKFAECRLLDQGVASFVLQV